MPMVNWKPKPISRMVKRMDYGKVGVRVVNWNMKSISRMANVMD